MNKIDSTESPVRLNRIALPLLPHMLATSITLPLEMLEAANNYSRLAGKPQQATVYLCAQTLAPVQVTGGLTLYPNTLLAEVTAVDLIILPALWRNPILQVRRQPLLVDWLKQASQQDTLFAAGGTGVAFLAEAGLLNHQPAATHWFYLAHLQHHYPLVDFKPHHLITRAGRIYCAGSVNSMADLMVHLIERAMGASIAHKVAQQFSHEIRKAFAAIHFAADHVTAHQDEAIIAVQAWLQAHYAEALSLADMVQIAGLTRRTLTRRFKQATDLSPMAYLQKLRLNQAGELLKMTNLTIAEIALQVGYNDSDYFSRLFGQHYQITPTDFRRSVRGKLFSL